MANWLLIHELRAPDGTTPRDDLYRAALDMTAWAEGAGCPRVVLSEHHGADDGYLPSPFVFGAAVAARTERIRIMISALVLPLRDPFSVAEDVAVLDVVSGGRVELTVVAGYVPDEFAMFGVPFASRGTELEERLAALVDALEGRPATFRGRTAVVTPRPLQRPRPFLVVGGRAPRRAARFGDAFLPPVADERLADAYRAECRRLGKGDGILLWPGGPSWVFVADDPEAAWATLRPHVEAEARSYATWAAASTGSSPWEGHADAASVRASGQVAVVTPDGCVSLARSLGPLAALNLKPLVGGLDPAVGWRSLELFVDRVLPHLDGGAGAATDGPTDVSAGTGTGIGTASGVPASSD